MKKQYIQPAVAEEKLSVSTRMMFDFVEGSEGGYQEDAFAPSREDMM